MTRWPWPRVGEALRSIASIARHEFRMTLRERAGWGSITAACALAFADSALKPHSPLVSGIRASLFGAGLVLAPLALIFVAGAARRDDAVAAGDVVNSRPYPVHLLLLARFLGNYAVVLFAYALVIGCGLAAPLALAGRWPSPLTPIHSFGRGLVPLFYVTALAFCGVAMARNVLAAGVVAAYWLFIFLWGDYLARIFNFTLTQNWPTYALVSIGVICCAVGVRHGSDGARRGRTERRLLLALAGLLVVLGVADAWRRVVTTHDRPLHFDPLALNMAAQHIGTTDRVPGFWLRDQRGRPFRISSTNGRALAVLFWSPHQPHSVPALATLRAVAAEFPENEVNCIAVCLSDDHAISAHIAAQAGYRFPMVTDTGTHFTPAIENCSPLAEAYTLSRVPAIFVTDRGRRVVTSLFDKGTEDCEAVFLEIRKALAIPVPPS